MRPAARVHPGLAVVAVVEAAAARRHPEFLHGGLAVDDHMGVVVEDQGQYIAAYGLASTSTSSAADPIIGLAFDAVEHLVRQRKKFGFGHNPACKNYGVPSVPPGIQPHWLYAL